jgi:hypothetical protein
MESTTTSLQAVPRLPTTVAISAPAGERTTVAIASHDSEPDQDATTPSLFRTQLCLPAGA